MLHFLSSQALHHNTHFKDLFQAYIQSTQDPEHSSPSNPIRQLFGQMPNLDGLSQQIAHKSSFPGPHRQTLSEVLQASYAQYDLLHEQTQAQIKQLEKPNTFTVTTGHQLNVALGPAYLPYKLLGIIQLAEKLKQAHPDKQFIPVYWMASEDHDIEEIRQFRLFGKDKAVPTDYAGVAGDWPSQQIADYLRKDKSLPEHLIHFYAQSDGLREAHFRLVHHLFHHHGLLILDADHPKLKAEFEPLMQEELNQRVAHRKLKSTEKALQKEGYDTQAWVRPINLFYIHEGKRCALEWEEDKIVCGLGENIEDWRQELREHPERFSPNVITRPLYQEYILPNVAYMGGPAEIAYWLQLKPLFEHFGVPFPVLMPRPHLLFLNKANLKRWQKLELEDELLFRDLREIKNVYVDQHEQDKPSLGTYKGQMNKLWTEIGQTLSEVEGSLKQSAEAAKAKTFKELAGLEKKMDKALDQRHETSLRQIEKIYDFLYPENGLQERKESFLTFWLNHKELHEELLEKEDVFDFSLKIYGLTD